jgi:hypothetical protein
MCKFPEWFHEKEDVLQPGNIADQLDSIPDSVLFTEPTDPYEDVYQEDLDG